jgi:hypothetical protein
MIVKMLFKTVFSHQFVNEEPSIAVTPADEVDNVPVSQLCQDFHVCLKLLLRLKDPADISLTATWRSRFLEKPRS